MNHYYFYCVDRDFGPFFLKFCSYFPYNAKLCLNGHEYVKRQLAQQGNAYEALDNGVLSCADPTVQSLCHALPAFLQLPGGFSNRPLRDRFAAIRRRSGAAALRRHGEVNSPLRRHSVAAVSPPPNGGQGPPLQSRRPGGRHASVAPSFRAAHAGLKPGATAAGLSLQFLDTVFGGFDLPAVNL